MSTTVMSDATVKPTTESTVATAKLIPEMTEVEFVKCDCCGLTEECTPQYIEMIRERYLGLWICGLCGEAVEDEIVRSKQLISTEEAMARHVSFCRTLILSNPPPDPTFHLIATVRQILRRGLESLTSVKSMPCSPAVRRSGSGGCSPSERCISDLVVDLALAYESEEDSEGSNLQTR